MKKFAIGFLRRGVSACGLGPVALAIVYLVLQWQADLQTLTVGQVCVGILSLTALAFIAGGMNAIYQIERLPLVPAIFIHGSLLYLSYLATYLLNDWLQRGLLPILVFSGIFVVGFFAIWAVIYAIIRQKIKRLNEILRQKQENEEAPTPCKER